MKKKVLPLNQDLKMPHMFREDLENIEEIITKELSPREYKLESESFEYTSIKEISGDTGSTNHFYIKTYSPYISIDFSKSYARVYTDEDDLKTIGAFKKILAIISKRERKTLWIFSKLANYLAPSLLTFTVILPRSAQISQNMSLFLVSTSLLMVWIIFGFWTDIKKYSIIEFVNRKNKSNFFYRNKDQIGVNILVGIVFLLLGYFVKK